MIIQLDEHKTNNKQQAHEHRNTKKQIQRNHKEKRSTHEKTTDDLKIRGEDEGT